MKISILKKNAARLFFTSVVLVTSAFGAKAQNIGKTDFLYFTDEQINAVKNEIQSNDKKILPFVEALKHQADQMITKGPWTITSVHASTPSGDPHDYYSEGPYWWPNPNNPNGPYIRKDGLRNPGRFVGHHNLLDRMYEAVSYLSIAAYFFDDQKYADHASEIISTWFLDKKTKMNPNLNYAQAVRGRSTGRGTGIIDTHRFSQFIEAINFLKASGKWNETQHKNLQNWFKEYLGWLLNSKNGRDEKKSGNNHATWWAAQVMACSIFLNDSSAYNMAVKFAKNDLIAKEIEANGSCPREEARTKSLSYSVMNLDAFSLICRMAMLRGENLWNYASLKGGSVEKAVDYLLPYVNDPSMWNKKQILPFGEKQPSFLALAYFDLNKPDYLKVYMKTGDTVKKEISKDPFSLLLNITMIR